MVLAPHPDDEALGAGGFIQQAVAAGAKVRVIFGTNGDNNPWPQRWLESRWHIDMDGRKRWGKRRRDEALRSLSVLGVPEDHAEFMEFPDTELLPRWNRRDAATLAAFAQSFQWFAPEFLIVPSPLDRHPDHRGMYHLAQSALAECGLAPLQWSYLIHPGWLDTEPTTISLHLDRRQQAAKLQAILCHETQTSLSRGRFSSYARPEEFFHPEPPVTAPSS